MIFKYFDYSAAGNSAASRAFSFFLNLKLKFLNELTISIVNKALFKILFVPTILLKILVKPASSNTDLTDDQALSPVPGLAGTSLMLAALNFLLDGYGTVPSAVIVTSTIFLYAS